MKYQLQSATGLLIAGLSFFVPSIGLSQLDPDSSYVEISYEGPVDSFTQSGSLQHDGSIGPNVPISFTIKVERPEIEALTITETGSYRETSILAEVQMSFGNYCVSEKKLFNVYQLLAVDVLRLDFQLLPTVSNFTGTLFMDDSAIDVHKLRQLPLSPSISVYFSYQEATIENFWDRFIRGEISQIDLILTWADSANPGDNVISAEFRTNGFSLDPPYPGDPFSKPGLRLETNDPGYVNVFDNMSTTNGIPLKFIDVSPKNPSGYYSIGAEVTFSIKDWDGFTFSGWSGSVSDANDSIAVVIEDDFFITANFEPGNAYEILNTSELISDFAGFSAFRLLEWDPLTKKLFAAYYNDDRTNGREGPVVELDPQTGQELAWIGLEGQEVEITPDGNELWVTEDGSAIYVVDLRENSESYFQETHLLETPSISTSRFRSDFNIFFSKFGHAYFVSKQFDGFRQYDINTKSVLADVVLEAEDQSKELRANLGMFAQDGNRFWLAHNTYYIGGADTAFSIELDPSDTDFLEFVEQITSFKLKPESVLEYNELESLFAIGWRRDLGPDSRTRYLERINGVDFSSKLLFAFRRGAILPAEYLGDGKLLFQTYGNSLENTLPADYTPMELVIFDLRKEMVSHRLPMVKEGGAVWSKGDPGFLFVSNDGKLLRIDYTEPQLASISVDANWTVSESGEVLEIPVTASDQAHWQGLTEESWITIHDDWKLYTGSGSILLTVDKNATDETRQGTVFIYGQPVTITQPPETPFVDLNHDSWDFSTAGGSFLIELSSNTDWTASSDSEWVEIVSETSGSGSGWLSLYVRPNDTAQERQASILINEKTFVVTQAAGPAEIVRTPTGGSSDFTAGVHEVTIGGRPAVILVGENYDPATPTYLAYYLHGDEGGYDWWTSPSSPIAQLINEKGWVYVAPLAPQTGDNFQWENNRESNLQLVEEVLEFMFSNFNVYREHVFGAGASGGSFFHDAFFYPTKGQQFPSYFALTCGASGMAEGGTNYSAVESASNDELFLSRSELHYAIGTEDFLFPPALISMETYSELGYSVSADILEGVGHCDFSLDTKIAEYWLRKATQLDELFGDSVPGVLDVAEGQWNENPDTIGWLYGSEGTADLYAYSTQLGNIYHADFPWIYDYEWGWIRFLSREDGTGPVHYYHGDLGHLTIFDESAAGWFYSWDLNTYDNFVSPAGLISLP
jgi:hypothetical protein